MNARAVMPEFTKAGLSGHEPVAALHLHGASALGRLDLCFSVSDAAVRPKPLCAGLALKYQNAFDWVHSFSLTQLVGLPAEGHTQLS